MRQALWIWRKDIRHLWPRAAVFVALAALYANGDAAAPHHAGLEGAGMIFSFALWVAAAFVVVSVIHEDRLVGDRQFWTTRPYSWKSLLLAKGLFVLVFVNLPVLLAQSAELLSNGLSPAEYAPQLFWRQVTLAAWTIFPCAALAAVTRNLVQAVVAALTAGAVFMVVLFEVMNEWAVRHSAAAVDHAGHAAAAIFLAGLACMWQFARRGTWLARCWFVCGVASSVTLYPIVPWGAAITWLMWSSPATDAAAVRLAADFPRRVRGGWGYIMDGDKIPIFFPIQAAGVPDRWVVRCEGVRVTLQAPGGKTWSSGWSRTGEVVDSRFAVGLNDFLPGAGPPYWLLANVDKSFYDAFAAKPVHVRAEVAFTLFDRARTTQLTKSGEPDPIADHGFCYSTRQERSVSVLCITPFRELTYSELRMDPPRLSETGAVMSAFGIVGGTGGTVFSIWADSNLYGEAAASPFEAFIDTRHTVAHFTREVNMPSVVLAELRGQ